MPYHSEFHGNPWALALPIGPLGTLWRPYMWSMFPYRMTIGLDSLKVFVIKMIETNSERCRERPERNPQDNRLVINHIEWLHMGMAQPCALSRNTWERFFVGEPFLATSSYFLGSRRQAPRKSISVVHARPEHRGIPPTRTPGVGFTQNGC